MRILITGASGFIGTNAVAQLNAEGDSICNLDVQPPLDPTQRGCWKQVDILDPAALAAAFAEFAPEAVIHLAARTDCDEATTVDEGYRVNTEGTANVLAAIKATPLIRRVIVVSTQFVCGPGYAPRNDEDFRPVTVYGQSKVITEQLTRAAELACVWTIVRPTNVWGPWHQRYQREFWHVVAKGWYVHPSGPPVVRCYAYVGNTVRQIRELLDQPAEVVNGQMFYLSDQCGDVERWVNSFSLALRGRKVRVVPRPVLAVAGLIGDFIGGILGCPFYINSSRYRSMTSDYLVNLDKTFLLLGQPTITLEQGVEETVAWLRTQT